MYSLTLVNALIISGQLDSSFRTNMSTNRLIIAINENLCPQYTRRTPIRAKFNGHAGGTRKIHAQGKPVIKAKNNKQLQTLTLGTGVIEKRNHELDCSLHSRYIAFSGPADHRWALN